MRNARAKAKTSVGRQHRQHMKTVGSKLSQSNEDLLEACRKNSPTPTRRDVQTTGAGFNTEPTNCQHISSSEKTANGDVGKKPDTSEAVEVLLKILLQQEELTLEEYTLNSQKFKVLVIEDTEFWGYLERVYQLGNVYRKKGFILDFKTDTHWTAREFIQSLGEMMAASTVFSDEGELSYIVRALNSTVDVKVYEDIYCMNIRLDIYSTYI